MNTIYTTTQEFTLGNEIGVTVANSSTSTGTLTIQLKLGTEWVTLGTVTSGTAQYVDTRNVTIRLLVTGTVSYGVR